MVQIALEDRHGAVRRLIPERFAVRRERSTPVECLGVELAVHRDPQIHVEVLGIIGE